MATQIHARKEYGGLPVAIAVVIIIVLVGVALFIYASKHHNEYETGEGYSTIEMTNRSSIPREIHFDGQHFTLDVGEQKSISIPHHTNVLIKGYNYDGTVNEEFYRTSDLDAHHIYITNSGVKASTSGGTVELVNNSDIPVMFVEQSPQGARRWETGILPPRAIFDEYFVGKGTVIQAVHPTREDKPIAQLTVNGIANKIVFDGKNLFSE